MRSVATMFLLASLLYVAGCSSDETAGPVDPCAMTPDDAVIGLWMSCDEDWEYKYNGVSIHSDGSCEMLGVDWTTGAPAVMHNDIYWKWITNVCATEGIIVRTFENDTQDTLSYVLADDRMELREYFFDQMYIVRDRYRKAQPDQPLWDAASISFSANVDGTLYTVPMLGMEFPAGAESNVNGNNTYLSIKCFGSIRFEMVVDDFHGTDTYTLAEYPKDNYARIYIVNAVGEKSSYCNSTHKGELTILTYDETRKRCTGSFWFDADGPGGEHSVSSGQFDVPFRKKYY